MQATKQCHLLHTKAHARTTQRQGPAHRFVTSKQIASRRQITRRLLRSKRSTDEELTQNKASTEFALAAVLAPLLAPLQAFCQEQIAFSDTSPTSPEVVSMVSASLAVPLVIYGAVSVAQQIRQTNEEAALRLRAINTHNTFLSQEEGAEYQALRAHPAAHLVMNSTTSGPTAGDSQSSTDEPDAAAPAMLDQPERPEPKQSDPPATASTDEDQRGKADSQVPPQTAVLDRPERPEPNSAAPDGNMQADLNAGQPNLQFSFAMSEAQSPNDLRGSGTRHQARAVALQAEYEAKIKGLKGLKESLRPDSRQQAGLPEAADLASEYASKLAQLHEESANRAEDDLRKRQQRYVMLANLQAQAEMSRPSTPVEASPVQEEGNKVVRLLTVFKASIIAIVARMLASLRKIFGLTQDSDDLPADVQYGSS